MKILCNLILDFCLQGAVTPVKDQGQCGSCWAFSAIGTAEGAISIASGYPISLSEQELLDCDANDDACNGGNPYLGLEYLIQKGGINTEADYPYEARQYFYCR